LFVKNVVFIALQCPFQRLTCPAAGRQVPPDGPLWKDDE
jgi:hypothetical protein